MRQTKYVMSGGLAFSEDKDMEKLRSYSLNGWHVSGFKFMGYTLEKGESSDYIYSVDYRSLAEGEKEEYFDLFSNAGWSHIASAENIYLFRAHPGTKPIYSDRDTMAEKQGNSIASMKSFVIPFTLITAMAWIGAVLSSGILESILLLLAVILSIVAIPTAWTVLTTYSNKWREEGRRGLVKLVRMIPYLILLLVAGAVVLLGFNSIGTTVKILISMMVGAIVFPTAMWIIMSLYHKVGSKRAPNHS